MNVVELSKALISYPSISPCDAGAIEYIAEFLCNLRFTTVIKNFNGVNNLYAEYGSCGKNLCFSGHIDVVGPVDEALWDHAPFDGLEKDGKLYGRGAVDMKCGIAAALIATRDFLLENPDFDQKISFLLTSDEEIDGTRGAEPMLKWLEQNGYKIDFAILSEPTSEEKFGDRIKIGRRGSVNFDLRLKGVAGHVAYPYKARNPLNILGNVINGLYAIKFDQGTESFDPTNLEITTVDVGNNATNVIPSEVFLKFNIRFNTEHTPENLSELVKKAILLVIEGLEYSLDENVTALPFLVHQDFFCMKFADIVYNNTGIRPIFVTNGGTSDARYLKNYCNLLEFGLLNDTAHKINEYTEISHLQTLKNVYYDAIFLFFVQ